jgi:hypothetical protein
VRTPLFEGKFKDRILNGTLIGAIALLVVSFTHSTISKNTGQPTGSEYTDSKVKPLSAKSLSTYNPLPLLNSDGSEIPQAVTPLTSLPGIPRNNAQSPGANRAITVHLPDAKLTPLSDLPLPILNQPLNETLEPVIAPVTSLLDPLTDTLKKIL